MSVHIVRVRLTAYALLAHPLLDPFALVLEPLHLAPERVAFERRFKRVLLEMFGDTDGCAKAQGFESAPD